MEPLPLILDIFKTLCTTTEQFRITLLTFIITSKELKLKTACMIFFLQIMFPKLYFSSVICSMIQPTTVLFPGADDFESSFPGGLVPSDAQAAIARAYTVLALHATGSV